MTGIPRARLHSSKDIFEIVADLQKEIRRLKRAHTSGWVSTGIANGFGVHTLTGMGGKHWNRSVSIKLFITLGAAVTVGGQGGIANTHVADLIAPWIPEAPDSQFLVTSTSPLIIGAVSSNGQVNLVNSVPGAVIGSGLAIVLGGTYLL